MNLSTIKTAVMDFGWKASRKLNQYSPEIAFGLGVICFGKTIYEATKAGPALDSVTLKAQEKMALVKKVAEENEEYAAEDAGVQSLYPAAQNGRIGSELLNLLAGITQTLYEFLCAAGGEQLHAVGIQRLEDVLQTVLVIDGYQRCLDRFSF